MQTQVAAYNTDVVGHNLVHLADTLRDEHFLLVGHRAFVVPFRHLVVPVVQIHMLQRILGGSVGIDDGLDKRIRRQTVTAVQSCTRALAQCIQAFYGRLSVEVDLDTAAHVVSSRAHGDIVGGDVNTNAETLLIDIREVVLRFCRVLMGDVQTDMVQTVYLHLLIYRTGHNITRSQRQTLVVFLHKGLTVGQFQDTAIAAHSLSDKVGGMRLLGIMQHRRMELHKLHIGHRAFGAIDHSDTVARSNDGIRRRHIDGTATARTHDGDFRQVSIDFLGNRIEHVGSITLDIRRTARHTDTQMMLRDNLYGKMVLFHLDIGIVANGLHQPALNLSTSIVGVVQNAELRMAALTVKVELTVVLTVEIDAPLHHFLNLRGGIAYHLFDGSTVADEITGYHRVFDVFVEIVQLKISHTGHTALGKRRVGFVQPGLTDDTHCALLLTGHFQGVTHACYTGTDNEEIVLVNHIFTN